MKVGTIRREALRLLNATAGEMIDHASITDLYQNPQYAYYLGGMEMSINRAVMRMQCANRLPMGRVVLGEPTVTGSVAAFDLGEIEDFAGVYEVRANTGETYAAHAYRWEGGTTLVVPFYTQGVQYVLLYRKKFTPLQPLCADDTVVDIPDELACLIPYFIKSECYEDEDAVAAKRARDYFENGLKAYEAEGESTATKMESKYKWEDL